MCSAVSYAVFAIFAAIALRTRPELVQKINAVVAAVMTVSYIFDAACLAGLLPVVH
jgi:uncharacterized membrane protein